MIGPRVQAICKGCNAELAMPPSRLHILIAIGSDGVPLGHAIVRWRCPSCDVEILRPLQCDEAQLHANLLAVGVEERAVPRALELDDPVRHDGQPPLEENDLIDLMLSLQELEG